MTVHRWRSRLRPALALAVALACISACGSTNTPASAESPTPGCNVYDDLTEKIVAFSLNELAGEYPAVGDSATYLTRLYDKGGNLVGTVEGKANIPSTLPNGDTLEYSEERITLPGGVIETQGFYNLTKGLDKQWQFLPAIGVSGGFKDKLGKREFQILKKGEDLNAKISICPVPG